MDPRHLAAEIIAQRRAILSLKEAANQLDYIRASLDEDDGDMVDAPILKALTRLDDELQAAMRMRKQMEDDACYELETEHNVRSVEVYLASC